MSPLFVSRFISCLFLFFRVPTSQNSLSMYHIRTVVKHDLQVFYDKLPETYLWRITVEISDGGNGLLVAHTTLSKCPAINFSRKGRRDFRVKIYLPPFNFRYRPSGSFLHGTTSGEEQCLCSFALFYQGKSLSPIIQGHG